MWMHSFDPADTTHVLLPDGVWHPVHPGSLTVGEESLSFTEVTSEHQGGRAFTRQVIVPNTSVLGVRRGATP